MVQYPKEARKYQNKQPGKKILIIWFYRTLRLFNTQSPMIALIFVLMVTLKQSWFRNKYHQCLFESFTIAWLVHHNRVDLRRQEMQIIRSSFFFVYFSAIDFWYKTVFVKISFKNKKRPLTPDRGQTPTHASKSTSRYRPQDQQLGT